MIRSRDLVTQPFCPQNPDSSLVVFSMQIRLPSRSPLNASMHIEIVSVRLMRYPSHNSQHDAFAAGIGGRR